jgi:hypothetical protein
LIKSGETIVKNCILNFHVLSATVTVSCCYRLSQQYPHPKVSFTDASVVVFLTQPSLNKLKIMHSWLRGSLSCPLKVECPSSVVRILVSAWRESPKKSRKIEWWQTVLPWWLSTDLSGVQGLHYHFNQQGFFVMDSVDICGRLWKYVNKIGNLLKA